MSVTRYGINDQGVFTNLTDGGYVSYQDYEKLAAENAGLKSKGRELLTEACSVYEKFNATINSEDGDFIDGQTLHEFQFVLDCETPVTDAFLAEVRAQGVDMLAEKLRENIAVDSSGSTRARALTRIVDRASDQIRKGVQS